MKRIFSTIFALVSVVFSSACIIGSEPQPVPQQRAYSPVDYRLSTPSTPAIDTHFDLVFPGVPCVAANQSTGISSWRVTIPGTTYDSNLVGCFDYQNQMPFAVRFEGLLGYTSYDLQATGYVFNLATGQSDACYVVDCSAITSPYAEAVLPLCSMRRVC